VSLRLQHPSLRWLLGLSKKCSCLYFEATDQADQYPYRATIRLGQASLMIGCSSIIANICRSPSSFQRSFER
jgi:hypothetical protein